MIIEFKKKEQEKNYLEQLSRTADKLYDFSTEFFGLGLHLALSGKWKKWDESMAVGSEVNFDEVMLLDTGDDIVTRIIKLKIEIDILIQDIDERTKN